ncbi:MAG: hypothetical protein E6G56_00740 [Actinobacteria bacterium]|nr:MAG: hypothetical protein E6G56_00740 [Actinomycetota bacterium]
MQSRGDVYRVADHRVAGPDLTGEHLARVDPDPEAQLRPVRSGVALVDLVHRRLHRQGGPHRALGVVLVGHRRSEDGHHVVADVLVDRASIALDLLAQSLQRAVQQRLDRLWVEPLGHGGIAGEVGE